MSSATLNIAQPINQHPSGIGKWSCRQPLTGLRCFSSSFCGVAEKSQRVELSGDVGCCNLLVRAVQLPRDVIGRQSAPSPDVIGRSASRDVAGRDAIGCESAASSCWSYVAHELRSVDEIDGSLMHTILRHRSHTHTHTHTHTCPSVALRRVS